MEMNGQLEASLPRREPQVLTVDQQPVWALPLLNSIVSAFSELCAAIFMIMFLFMDILLDISIIFC
jgi:hypothetical protein